MLQDLRQLAQPFSLRRGRRGAHLERIEADRCLFRAADRESHADAAVPGRELVARLGIANWNPVLSISTCRELKAMSRQSGESQINPRRFRTFQIREVPLLAFVAAPEQEFALGNGQTGRICR